MTESLEPVLVAPGVWRITTPLPYRPRSVHAYLVENPDGAWFLLDGGIDSEEAWSVLDGGVRRIVGSWSRVELHVVSHMHMDHIGLVDRVREARDGLLAIGELDAARAAHAAGNPAEESIYRAELLRSCGAPAEFTARIASLPPPRARPFGPVDIELPSSASPLPGVAGWRAIWTPGHTAGHVALIRDRDRVLLAADAVLPRITPTIGVNRQRRDPVGDYLQTLEQIAALEPALALCGHGDPVDHPVERVWELQRATLHETDRVGASLRGRPSTAWEITEQLYAERELPAALRMLAVRETLAHLEHLCRTGRAELDMVKDVKLFSSP